MSAADKLAQVLAEHGCDYEDCASCGPVDDLAAHQAAVVLAHLTAEGWAHGVEEWGFSLSVYAEGNVALARSKEAAEKAANAWPNLDPKLYRRRVTDWEPVEGGRP